MLRFSEAWLQERLQRIGALDQVSRHEGAAVKAYPAFALWQPGSAAHTSCLHCAKPVPHAQGNNCDL
eukprot:331733-Chlamydomonas_euryale.AAC.10